MSQYRINQGFAFLRQYEHSNAISEFEAVLKIDQTCEMAHFGIGEVFRDQNKNIAAIRSYDKVLGINPNSVKALAFKICVLKNLSRNEEIQKIGKALGEIVPQDAYDYLGLGLLQVSFGKPLGAMTHYQKAMKQEMFLYLWHIC